MSFAVSAFPPWTIIQEEKISGIDVDIVKLVGNKLNIKIEFYPCPWARCLNLLEQGEIDLASNLFKTPEREGYLSYFSEPYIKGTYRLFYLNKSTGVKITQFEDLIGKTVGQIAGMQYFPRFDTNQSINKLKVATRTQLIGMLLKHRIDAFIGQEDVMDHQLNVLNYETQITKSLYRQFVSEPGYFAFSKKSNMLGVQVKFERELQTLLNNGSIEEVIISYKTKSAAKILIRQEADKD